MALLLKDTNRYRLRRNDYEGVKLTEENAQEVYDWAKEYIGEAHTDADCGVSVFSKLPQMTLQYDNVIYKAYPSDYLLKDTHGFISVVPEDDFWEFYDINRRHPLAIGRKKIKLGRDWVEVEDEQANEWLARRGRNK